MFCLDKNSEKIHTKGEQMIKSFVKNALFFEQTSWQQKFFVIQRCVGKMMKIFDPRIKIKTLFKTNLKNLQRKKFSKIVDTNEFVALFAVLQKLREKREKKFFPKLKA